MEVRYVTGPQLYLYLNLGNCCTWHTPTPSGTTKNTFSLIITDSFFYVGHFAGKE